MPLTNVKLLPGFDKTDTPSGAEGRWIDGDFVRFRYNQPEKIGGFAAIGQQTISGPARAQHTWTDLEGRKYGAIGTSKVLLVYYEDAFYDITPLDAQLSGTATFDTVQGSADCTVNLTGHGLANGRYIVFNTMSVIPNGFVSATPFTDNAFEIRDVTTNSFKITAPIVAVNPGGSATGQATVKPYVEVGPTFQTAGYGWSTYLWGDSTWGTERTVSNVILDQGNFK